MQRWMALFAGFVTLSVAAPALAVANYVYHEQTTNVTGGACGQYLDTPTPGPTDTYPLRWKVEWVGYTDNLAVYYTTDGTAPSGSFGVASGTSLAIPGTYACTFPDTMSTNTDDVGSAVIPAQPAGTNVQYIIGAWHSGGGSGNPEIFANSGNCSTCTPCVTSTCATVFSYAVSTPDAGPPDTGPPDAGVDSGPPDAGFDAGTPDSGTDAATADASADVAADILVDAGVDVSADILDVAVDAGVTDIGPMDVGPVETGVVDTGTDVVVAADTGADAGNDTGSGHDSGGLADVISGDGGDGGTPPPVLRGGACGCSTAGGARGGVYILGALVAGLGLVRLRKRR